MEDAVVDLFAGAGGFSVGFSMAGFNSALAIEQDLWASETYALNHKATKLITADIRNISDSDFKSYQGVAVVIGGPPCQGFSISASHRRKKDDPRNYLYLEFIRAVEQINPEAVVIENVKEIQKFILPNGKKLCLDIQERLSSLGFYSEVLTLNASNFGVPQDRRRSFIIGGKNQGKLKIAIESLQHQNAGLSLFNNFTNLTLWDAISDLPPVKPWEINEEDQLSYQSSPRNEYQEKLRTGSTCVFNHVPMRHTPRMIERFSHLIENGRSRNIALPKELGPRARNDPLTYSAVIYDQNHRLLEPNKLSPTITASFYSSFIHPFQPRNLTVREAARLQSFPDTYIFKGKRTTLSKKLLEKKGILHHLYLDQFNQVGNSVPPLLSYHIALQIKKMLK